MINPIVLQIAPEKVQQFGGLYMGIIADCTIEWLPWRLNMAQWPNSPTIFYYTNGPMDDSRIRKPKIFPLNPSLMWKYVQMISQMYFLNQFSQM